jgi:sec-independent protein translocase protein TatA
MGLGFWELAVLLVVVLLFFGAHKLPSAMGDIAKGIKAFKAGMRDQPVAGPPADPPTAPPAEPLRLTDRRGDGAS